MKKQIMLFTSKTCASCKTFKPIVEEIVNSYSGVLELQVYDVEEYPSLVSAWQIRTVPALVAGGITHTGPMGKSDTSRWLHDMGVL